MKKFGMALMFVATMLLISCGTDKKTDPSGTWTVTLTPTQDASIGSATAMAFTDTLTTSTNQSGRTDLFVASVTASGLTINTNNGCLAGNASQSADYRMDTTGNVFTMNVMSPASGSDYNVLILSGTLTNNVISGDWTLNPTSPNMSCTGSGTFLMKLVSGSNLPKHG